MATNLGSAYAEIRLNQKKLAKDVKKVKGSFGNMQKGVSGAMKKIAGAIATGFALKKITDGIKKSVVAFADFEEGLNKVSTIADETVLSTEKLGQGVKELQREFGEADPQKFTDGIYGLISATGDSASAMEQMGIVSKVAIGGFANQETAVDGLTSVMNAYGQQGADAMKKIGNQMLVAQNLGKTTFNEMAQYIGQVAPLTAKLGIETDELFGSIASLTKQGIKTSQSMTGLKAIFSNILKPTADAEEAAKSLGIEFNAMALKSKGLGGFMGDIREKLQNSAPAYMDQVDKVNKLGAEINRLEKSYKENGNATDEQKAHLKALKKEYKESNDQMKVLEDANKDSINIYAKLFGSVQALNSALVLTSKQGMKDANDATKEMATNTTAVDDAAEKMMRGLKFRFGQMSAQISTMMINIGDKLSNTTMFDGILEKASAFLRDINIILENTDKQVSKFTNLLIKNFNKFKAKMGEFKTQIAEYKPVIDEVIANFLKLGDVIQKTLQPIIQVMTDVIIPRAIDIWGTLMGALRDVGDVIIENKEKFTSVGEVIANVIDIVSELVKEFVEFLVPILVELAVDTIPVLIGIVEGLAVAFGGVIKGLKTAYEKFKELDDFLGGALTGTIKVLVTALVIGKGLVFAFSMLTKGLALAKAGAIAFKGALLLLTANPIILAITAIATAVYLIVKNWDKVKEACASAVGYVQEKWQDFKVWSKENNEERRKNHEENSQKIKEDYEKAVTKMKKAGKDWKEDAKLVWDTLKEKAKETTGEMKEAYSKSVDDNKIKLGELKKDLMEFDFSGYFDKSIERSKAKFKDFMGRIKKMFVEIGETSANFFKQSIELGGEMLQNMVENVQRFFISIGEFIAGIGKTMGSVFTDLFDNTIEGVQSAVDKVKETISTIVNWANKILRKLGLKAKETEADVERTNRSSGNTSNTSTSTQTVTVTQNNYNTSNNYDSRELGEQVARGVGY